MILMPDFCEEHGDHVQDVSCRPLKLSDNMFSGIVSGRVALSSEKIIPFAYAEHLSGLYIIQDHGRSVQ